MAKRCSFMPTTTCISHIGRSLNWKLAFPPSLKNVGLQQAQCFVRNGYNPLMVSQFSQRERQIIELLLKGKTNKEIALLLGISRRTVEFHASNIYAKLGVRTRAEAILKVMQDGDLWISAGLPKPVISTGKKSVQEEYSSRRKHSFTPRKEINMRNRTLIPIGLIVLSVVAVLGACLWFIHLRRLTYLADQSASQNVPQFTPTMETPKIVQVATGASTRNFNEVLLVLRTQHVPFSYAAVLTAESCFVPGEMPTCGFTDKFPFSKTEFASLSGNVVSWFPDGENGLVDYGGEILLLNYATRTSQIYKPDFQKANWGLHLSPDAKWLIESVNIADPYLSDLIMIDVSTGVTKKLNNLPVCFKNPIGWLSSTQFLFSCDIFTGATSKKNLSSRKMYTIDIQSGQLLPFGEEYNWMIAGVLGISPDGRSVAITVTQDPPSTLIIKDMATGQVYSVEIQPRLLQWSHDSSKLAVIDLNGNIYIVNRDGSDLQKIHQFDPQSIGDWSWLPNDNTILLLVYPDIPDIEKTELVSISMTGSVNNIDYIPTTDGYDVAGISPLPAIKIGASAIPTNTTPMSTSLPSVTSGSSTATIPMLPSQYIEIKSISDAQKAAKFHLLLPQFIPDNLQFSSGWVADFADGSEIIRLWYSEPGNPSDTDLKTLDLFQTLTDQPVTLQTILHQEKEIALDVQEVQVRGQSGFTYWEQSVAAGNSAHLAWREGGINYQLDLFGDWPAPNESNPHGLDNLLLKIAGSLQPIK
jgi:DNA-binding CsgD family transcriptional regulator